MEEEYWNRFPIFSEMCEIPDLITLTHLLGDPGEESATEPPD